VAARDEGANQVTAIGVLCARVRVEEKQIIAAIDQAGLVAVPVPPASTPLPPGPASPGAAMLGEFLDATTGETLSTPVTAVVDRAVNRSVASATLQLVKLYGVRTIDAGLAATGTRIQVASALAAAGIPRPESLVGFSEASSVAGAARLGYPATLLGLAPGSSATSMLDADTADAVIEHRVVLGDDSEAIVLLQAGAPGAADRTTIHVVGNRAIAYTGTAPSMEEVTIAEYAARTLGATLVAIELARTGGQTVVWDVLPVADFRQARLLGDTTIPDAIAALARSLEPVEAGRPGAAHLVVRSADAGGEVRHGLALSA